MYSVNSLKYGWWKQVTLIIWGATAQLIHDHPAIRQHIRDAIDAGVTISACKACADQLGVTPTLEALGIEVKYWGEPLTEILKAEARLLTV